MHPDILTPMGSPIYPDMLTPTYPPRNAHPSITTLMGSAACAHPDMLTPMFSCCTHPDVLAPTYPP